MQRLSTKGNGLEGGGAARRLMSNVVLSGLTKIFAAEPAVADIDLEIGSGELCVVLGPNGSGKTTLLRLIAGLESPTRGSVRIGGREVTQVSPHLRSVGMVFQDSALEPDWTVRQHLEFPLSVNRVAASERSARLQTLAAELGIADWLGRRVGELSGGEQRRVAIGRSLIRQPAVLLFDEPFASLDPVGRWELRRQLRTWLKARGTTALYVTHDAVEAQWLADRMAVLVRGKLLQVATPAELLQSPASWQVLEAVATWPLNKVESPAAGLMFAASAEDVRLVAVGEGKEWPAATVVQGSQVGSRRLVEFRWSPVATREVTGWAVLRAGQSCQPGERVGVAIDQERIHFFESATGRRVTADRGQAWLIQERNGKGGEL